MVEVITKVPALEKLLEYAASGAGSVVGAMLGPWIAARKARVARIEAQGKGDSLRIIAEAQADAQARLTEAEGTHTSVSEIQSGDVRQWVEFQETKRLSNIRSVIHRAADNLRDEEAPNDAADPDWTARFFNGVQDVSSEEMQELWARLLSGEILNPGSVSIQTISILRNMSRQDAETFTSFVTCEVNGIVEETTYRKLDARIPDYKIIALQELGLIHSPLGAHKTWVIDKDGKLLIRYRGHFLLIEGPPGSKIDVRGWVFTRPGDSLAHLSQSPPAQHYLPHFASFIATCGCTLKIAPTHFHPQKGDFMHINEAMLIEPAQSG